jgi:predicted DNA binding CopG/RHH family protein
MKLSALFLVCSLATCVLLPPGQIENDLEYAQELWQSVSDLAQWPEAPGTQAFMPGHAPHGKFITIHVNSEALSAMENNADAMPESATIAKENFDSSRKLLQITVMHKKSDEWFWVVYSPDGTVEKAGKISECITCHEGARREQVFTWQ